MSLIDTFTLANNFAHEYLQAHPNENVQGLQIQMRNYLQNQKKNGVKISDKNIAQVNAQIDEIYRAASQQIATNARVEMTPKSKENIRVLNSSAAAGNYDRTYESNAAKSGHYYDELNGMSRSARKKATAQKGREVRSAFASSEYLEFLRKNHPEMLAEVESNSVQKQVVKDSQAYVSSSKRKSFKKQQEIASQEEHANQRVSNGKRARNQKYFDNLDKKEIEAKRKVRMYNKELDGRVSVHVSNQKSDVLKEMREFYTKQAEEAAKNIANTVSNTTESAAKNVSKGGKTGLIAAGIAIVAGALAYLGLSDDKKTEENNFKVAA